jgi:[ribosomal protein S5]-alanine N-acetyltransferase
MTRSAQNGTTDFIIVHTEADHVIGKIGVWQDEEIGFFLSRKYWGQGMATEALLAIMEYLFHERSFQKITADVDPRNTRSTKLLQSLGFEKTGFEEKTLEIGGEWVDSVYLALGKQAWETRRKEQHRSGVE